MQEILTLKIFIRICEKLLKKINEKKMNFYAAQCLQVAVEINN